MVIGGSSFLITTKHAMAMCSCRTPYMVQVSAEGLFGEDCGRWSALVIAFMCTMVPKFHGATEPLMIDGALKTDPSPGLQLHLPSFALESCWPSLFVTLFSIEALAPYQMREARWATFMATVICLILNLGCLFFGAEQRRMRCHLPSGPSCLGSLSLSRQCAYTYRIKNMTAHTQIV